MEWISVSKGNPEPESYKDVWLWNGEEVVRGFRGRIGHYRTGTTDTGSIDNVTHWKEIEEKAPDPPKVKVRKEASFWVENRLGNNDKKELFATLPPDATNIKVSFDTEEK